MVGFFFFRYSLFSSVQILKILSDTISKLRNSIKIKKEVSPERDGKLTYFPLFNFEERGPFHRKYNGT